MTVLIEERDPDPDDVTYTTRCNDRNGSGCGAGWFGSRPLRDQWADQHEARTGHTVTRDEIRWVT